MIIPILLMMNVEMVCYFVIEKQTVVEKQEAAAICMHLLAWSHRNSKQ